MVSSVGVEKEVVGTGRYYLWVCTEIKLSNHFCNSFTSIEVR